MASVLLGKERYLDDWGWRVLSNTSVILFVTLLLFVHSVIEVFPLSQYVLYIDPKKGPKQEATGHLLIHFVQQWTKTCHNVTFTSAES